MNTRGYLIERIADLIADFREGEGIIPMNAAHVDRWIRQFPSDVQEPMLSELGHAFEQTYIGREEMERTVSAIATEVTLTGGNHSEFWRNAGVMRIQDKGNSQRDMLDVLDKALRNACGTSLYDHGRGPMNPYIYIDDFLFSGGRITKDVTRWIQESAPREATIVLYPLACHRSGLKSAMKDIGRAVRLSGKSISVVWLWLVEAEDRDPTIFNTDVLCPTAVPEDAATANYVAGLLQPRFRRPGQLGELGIFSSEEGRSLLERQFLMAGVQVLARCPLLNKPNMRPLGYDDRHSTGFGSLFVTYRNCPNNAPLALWAGDPWYPLFPRKTN